MTLLDIILILLVFGFVWAGFWSGLIRTIASLVGVFVGIFFAGIWYDSVSNWVQPIVGGNALVADIVGFILVYFVVTQAVGLLFWFANKIFHIFAILPGMKLLNRVGGAILGFIEGSLIVGVTLQFIGRLPLSEDWANRLAESDVVGYFTAVSAWLVPLFPKAIESVTSIFT